eukprot:TRINITY_DN74463_c0_g1_i1.p1 TRINITY_DN74463_c0_g1~~TRINITY_DN74463_c0_g1_i1.p1  ORF type:complete len:640 (-),score=150.39 TRINITY_DN74463_c0_g1_i1:68-1987(-)
MGGPFWLRLKDFLSFWGASTLSLTLLPVFCISGHRGASPVGTTVSGCSSRNANLRVHRRHACTRGSLLTIPSAWDLFFVVAAVAIAAPSALAGRMEDYSFDIVNRPDIRHRDDGVLRKSEARNPDNAQRQRLEKVLPPIPQASQFPQTPPTLQAPQAAQYALRDLKKLDLLSINTPKNFPPKNANGLMQSSGSVLASSKASLRRKEDPFGTESESAALAAQSLESSGAAASEMAEATQKVEELTAQAEKAKQEVVDAVRLAQDTAEAAEMSAAAGAAETQTMAPITHMATDPKEMSARRDEAMEEVKEAVRMAQTQPPKMKRTENMIEVTTTLPQASAAIAASSLASLTPAPTDAAAEAPATAGTVTTDEGKAHAAVEDPVAQAAEQISNELFSKKVRESKALMSRPIVTKPQTSKIAEASALREAALRQEIQDKAGELAGLRDALGKEVEASAARAKQAAVDADTAAGQVELTAQRARRAAAAAGAAAEEAAKKARDAEGVATAAARAGVEGVLHENDKKPALDAEDSSEERDADDTSRDDDLEGDKPSSGEDGHEEKRWSLHSRLQRRGEEKSDNDDDDDDKGTSRRKEKEKEEDDEDDITFSPRRRTPRPLSSPASPRRRSADAKSSVSGRRRAVK